MRAWNAFLKIFIVTLSVSFIAGCRDSPETSKNSAAPIHSPNIALSEIKNEKCLNLEKYLNILNSGMGNPSARRISTGFDVTPFKQNSISKNFELRLALGNFSFEDAPIAEFKELNSVSQVDCEKVIQTNESGPQEYKIINSTNDSMTIKNSWDDDITYQWVSQNHLVVTSRFVNGDFLCNENSKGRVSVKKEIFWGDELEQAETISASLIKESYLDLLSTATGYSKNNLFLDPNSQPEILPGETSGRIYISRLKEMSAQPIKAEALMCN